MSDITTTAFAKAINMDTMRSAATCRRPIFCKESRFSMASAWRGWVTAARRSYITDIAFAMERIQRLMGDRPQPGGPPPVPPDDPAGVDWFALE